MKLKKVCAVFFLFIFFLGSVSAFGIRPAKVEANFAPNLEFDLDFSAIFDKDSEYANFSIGGDLAEYFEIVGNGISYGDSVKIKVALPSEIGLPGYYNTYIYATEYKQGQGSSTIGSQVKVGALVKIFVPFEGQYVKPELVIPNANIDENLKVKLELDSLGSAQASVQPRVIIYDSFNSEAGVVSFQEQVISSLKKKVLEREVSTTGWRPGTYYAQTDLVYSGPVNNINQTFNVGSLFVNVTNYTKTLDKGAIRKFYLGISNGWNGNLEGVYANVNLTGPGGDISFRTPSVDLKAWSYAELEGFVDTSALDLGEYNAVIELNYGGSKSYSSGLVNVDSGSGSSWILIVAAVVVIGLGGFIYWRKKNIGRADKKI